MTKHEETAKRLLPCEFVVEHDQRECLSTDKAICVACRARPAVAAALAQAEAKGVRMGLERARELLEAEPEFPGEMPEEMWAAIKNHKDACAESHRIAVRETKKNVGAAIDAEIAKAGKEKTPA